VARSALSAREASRVYEPKGVERAFFGLPLSADFSIGSQRRFPMRSLSVIDVIIIGGVLALLLFLGTMDFPRYADRSFGDAPAPVENG
jgi:hypothetical protein